MTGAAIRCGVVLPGGTATEQLEQAVAAEQAGWDGIFVWGAGYGVDAWTLLAAMAARTSRVRLGTMLRYRVGSPPPHPKRSRPTAAGPSRLGYQPWNWPCTVQKPASAAMH